VFLRLAPAKYVEAILSTGLEVKKIYFHSYMYNLHVYGGLFGFPGMFPGALSTGSYVLCLTSKRKILQ
jgi:hypothetical protein